MNAPRYSRDELARLEKVLRSLAGDMTSRSPAVWDYEECADDLRQTADFLAETVGVLDRQRKTRQRQAANRALNRKRKGRSQ